MAESDLRVGIAVDDNASSVLNRIISRFELLTDDLRELGSAFNLLSNAQSKYAKSAQQAGAATAKAQSAFARRQQVVLKQLQELQKRAGVPITSEVDFQVDESAFREIRQLTQQIRSEVETGLAQLNAPTGVFDGLKAELRELAKLSSPSGAGAGNFANLLNFEEDRREVQQLVGSINEIRQKMREIGDAAEAGVPEAQDEFRKLAIDLDKAEGRAEQLKGQLSQVADEFEGFVGDANVGLKASGIEPITFDDFFPSAEQKKLNQLQDQLDREIALKVDQRAFQFTVNAFTGLNIQSSALNRNLVRLTSHLPRLRYAMYDVANTTAIFGAALIGISAGAVKIGADFERAFADVRRTVGDGSEESVQALEDIRKELIALSQDIPVSFDDLAGIATLAGQLNVAEDRIGSFTSTVAQFTATTDVSLDAAATAFGRLDQLVAGVNGNFEALASSILKVGVNAVATESDIIAISSQIASVANVAGFSADELIGFSSALASVGTRPELARGTFTRLFTEIQEAVAEGGEQLEAFARTANQSVDEFTSAWLAGEGADQVVAILRGLQEEGREADQVIRQLGITSVRDVPTLLKLAQGVEDVERQLAIAKIGFIENTELTRQYGILSSTLSERLVKLGNAASSLAATIGSATGPIGAVVDLLTSFISVVQKVLDNPVGKYFSAAALAVTAFIGVIALAVSGIARAVASFAGMFTAVNETAQAVLSINTSVEALGTSMLELAGNTGVANNALRSFSSQADVAGFSASRVATLTRASSGAVNLLGVNVGKTGQTFDLATRQANRAGFSFRSLGRIGGTIARFTAWGFAISAVVGVLGGLIDQLGLFNTEAEDAEEKANKLREALGGDVDSFIQAVQKDTEDYRNSVQGASEDVEVFIGNVKDGELEISDYGKVIAVATGQQELLTAATDEASDALERQGLVIGENTEKLIRQRLAQDAANRIAEASIGVGQIGEALRQREVATAGPGVFGADVQRQARSFIAERGADIGEAAIFELFTDQEISAQIRERGFELDEFFRLATTGQQEAADAMKANLRPALLEIAAELEATDAEKFADELIYLRGAAEFYDPALTRIVDGSNELRESIKELVFENALLGDSFDENTEAAENFRDALSATFDEAYAQVNAERALSQSLNALGAAFAENESSIVASGQEIQAVIDDIINASANPEEAISGLSALYTTLIDGGYASAEELSILRDQIILLKSEIIEANLEVARASVSSNRALLRAARAAGPESGLNASQIREDLRGAISDAAELQRQLSDVSRTEITTVRDVNLANELAKGYERTEDATGGAAANQRDLREETEETTEAVEEQVRTLLDYASDIDSVVSRAFDIRFAQIRALDSIADSWQSISERVQDARDSIEELRASQDELSSDRAIKEYFLSVAESYGDMLRAAQLRDEIAELDRQQAENARDLRQQQLIAGGDLTGDGPASRESRAALLNLVQEYQDYIVVLAESGASQNELRRATAEAREEFIRQATELGYQESVVLEYAEAFDDVTTAINNVPRDITVDANVNPALQALNELNARLRESQDEARELNRLLSQTGSGGGGNGGDGGGGTRRGSSNDPIEGLPGRPSNNPTITGRTDSIRVDSGGRPALGEVVAGNVTINSGGSTNVRSSGPTGISGNLRANDVNDVAIIQASRRNPVRDAISRNFQFPLFASGGYTGPGARMEPAGVVHRGEYVVPKNMVNQSSGLPNPGFLAQMQQMQGYANGGFVGGISGGLSENAVMVELSPFDRKLLQDAGNVQLRLNGRVVAEATNESNFNQARRGTN